MTKSCAKWQEARLQKVVHCTAHRDLLAQVVSSRSCAAATLSWSMARSMPPLLSPCSEKSVMFMSCLMLSIPFLVLFTPGRRADCRLKACQALLRVSAQRQMLFRHHLALESAPELVAVAVGEREEVVQAVVRVVHRQPQEQLLQRRLRARAQ